MVPLFVFHTEMVAFAITFITAVITIVDGCMQLSQFGAFSHDIA